MTRRPTRQLASTPASLVLQLLLVAGCGEHSTVPPSDALSTADGGVAAGDGAASRGPCDPMKDKSCVEIKRGEQTHHRWLTDYETLALDDEGTTRTVVRLHELIDAEIAEAPAEWRFKVYGTDGYTFGDYLTWAQILEGYIELGTRRVTFELSLELPHSVNVKDAYLIVLSPGG